MTSGFRLAPRAIALARSAVICGALVAASAAPPALAGHCTGFRPARVDKRGAPPDLARPVATLPADFDRDGVPDLAVVNRYIDGTLQIGSVTVLKGDLDGGLTVLSTRPTSGGATSAALNDFNKDGNPDLAAVNNAGAMIFLGDGAGGFLPETMIPLGFDPIHVSVADMNADMKTDLVVLQQYIGQPSGRVTVLQGDGSGGFTPRSPAPVGQSPRGAAVGDFNNDGKIDVVAGSTIGTSVLFLPGLGDGNFGAGVPTDVGASVYYLAAAHIDTDGKLDLVATGQTTGQHILTLRGNGNGTFTVLSAVPDGADPRNPVFCDFDHDGAIDVAVPDGASSNLSLMFGDGAGGFTAPLALGTDHGPAHAAISDINADGFCDVVTANESSDSVSLLLGGIRGSLGAPTLSTGLVPIGAVGGDFDNDGFLDVAVVNRDDDTMSIFSGDGEGGFALTQVAAAGTAPGSVAAADFNSDGWIDLVVANQGPATDQRNDDINVFYNDGYGGFYVGHTLGVGDLPLDVEAQDFNGDARPDIVVANSRSDRVSFYLAEPFDQFSNVRNVRISDPQRSIVIGDFTSDGVKDVAVSLMGLNQVLILAGDGIGGFTQGPLTTLPSPSPIDQIIGGDLNGDLIPDLAAISQPADPLAPGELTALIGVGEPGFMTPYPPEQTGVRPEALALIDLEGTGTLDAVVANRFDNDILILQGDGQGRFFPAERFGTGNDPFFFAPADYNNDSRMDLVVLNSGSNSLSLLLNNTGIDDVITDLTFTDDVRMVWTAVPSPVVYHVYRGQLTTLGPESYGQCVIASLGVAEYSDPAVPPAGDGYFYLLTTVTGGVESPLGYSSECLKRPNFNACVGL